MISDLVSASCEPESLVIAVEYASSSAHPWKDRAILRRVMEYEDGVILTANPDRLTRRADKIEELIEGFNNSGISWLSQGHVDHPRCWTEPSAATFEGQVRDGREFALQQSFYTSRMHQTTRIILAKKDEQYESIRVAIMDQARKFAGIVFLLRVSPNSQATQEETSLDTQKMFLCQFFETSFIHRATCISLHGVSAYSDDVLDAIDGHLDESYGSQLIVALSVDRVVRKESQLVRLRQILELGQHQICSLVWQQNLFDLKDT